ncbi:MAG: restriction endonuclease subunit S [Bacteroidaceae bacterium]|nr:restriction endonuclease subunit S [Bacteroidaceae bacterium]
MNAQQLKNSILQEAIEGRLVLQDPNDEPASVLLEKIRKEKAKLVKGKKIKADKNASRIYRTEDGHWMEHFEDKKREDICIDDEISFDIPKGWEYCRFSSLYWLLTDGTHSTPKYTLTGVPFLSVKDMSSGKLSFVNTKFISPEEHSLISQRCNPQKGDLLISKVGTTGIPLIIDTEKEFSIFVSLALVKFFPDLLDSHFLIHLINSPLVQSQVKEETRGIGNKNWVLTAISNTLMVLPPLAEQKRIVAKIEKLLPKVEEYGKAQESLDKLNEELPERLKKSILQEAIEGRLVLQDPNDEPASVLLDKIRAEKKRLVKEGKLKKKDLEETPISEDEIPFKIPESWEWCRLSNVGEIITGGTPSKSETKYYGNDYPFYKPADLEQGIDTIYSSDSLSVDGFEHSRKLPKNSILVTCIGSIGKTGLIRKEGTCNQQINAIIPFNIFIIPEYLFYFCLSSFFQESMWDSSSSTTLAILNKNKFSQLIIALPPLAEQKRIVEKIEQLMHEIDKLKM